MPGHLTKAQRKEFLDEIIDIIRKFDSDNKRGVEL